MALYKTLESATRSKHLLHVILISETVHSSVARVRAAPASASGGSRDRSISCCPRALRPSTAEDSASFVVATRGNGRSGSAIAPISVRGPRAKDPIPHVSRAHIPFRFFPPAHGPTADPLVGASLPMSVRMRCLLGGVQRGLRTLEPTLLTLGTDEEHSTSPSLEPSLDHIPQTLIPDWLGSGCLWKTCSLRDIPKRMLRPQDARTGLRSGPWISPSAPSLHGQRAGDRWTDRAAVRPPGTHSAAATTRSGRGCSTGRR